MNKVLLHSCCAPCTTFTNNWLNENEFSPTAYFYNPNIFQEGEYVKRYFVLKKYAAAIGLPLRFEFDNKKTEPGRCGQCYFLRLKKTAQYAKNNKFDVFTTTLLISPYQDHELIRDIGERVQNEVGVEFFYHDFREGYYRSSELSKEYKLYRQKYCGCKSSLESKRSKKDDKIAQAVA